jgi:hypothetical protein
MAHSYNPSYSGDRDQEDCGSKTGQANSSWEYWKIPNAKKIYQSGLSVECLSSEHKALHSKPKNSWIKRVN